MARIFIAVPPFTGHVNPSLSLGAALIKRGHEVCWISVDASLQQQLPQYGKLLLIAPQETAEKEKEKEDYLNAINSKVVYGIDSIKFLYDDVLLPMNRYMYTSLLQYLEKHQPDIVISDHQLFAGAMAAVVSGIPYVTSITAPAALKVMDDLPKIRDWELAKILELQNNLGLDIKEALDSSPYLNLVFTSKPFFGEMELPEHFKFVGPVITHRKINAEFNWLNFNNRPERKKVLVSIGTTFDLKHKQSFFEKVTEAFAEGNYTIVVVADPELFMNIPDNFIVQKRVPQIELLPHLDAVICHGGNNTVCESLSFGLPLVVIPIAYDQSHVAGRVVNVGAGLRLNFNRFKAMHLKQALEEILSKESYAAQARMIGASFEEAGGAEKASKYIEEVLNFQKINFGEEIVQKN